MVERLEERAAELATPSSSNESQELPASRARLSRASLAETLGGSLPLAVSEITAALPPVDDLSQCIVAGGGQTRFTWGDGGEPRLTAHLWETILTLGLDEETRQEVLASAVQPESLPGPLPTRAGLTLLREGAFYPVDVRAGSQTERWIRGTLLGGGHAERMVARDCVVTPEDGPQLVPTFVVEGHRESTGHELAPTFDLVAPPRLRTLAAFQDQFEIWSAVASLCARFAPTTRSLLAAASSASLGAVLREEVATWLERVQADNSLGVVLFHEGAPIAADIFRRREDLDRYLEGILRGYVLEILLLNDSHSAHGLEIASASSRQGKQGLARLLVGEPQGQHLDDWHTFLAIPPETVESKSA